MNTNLEELKQQFEKLFETEPFTQCKTEIKTNDKKSNIGFGAINFRVTVESAHPLILSATLYIVEQAKGTTVLFVHDTRQNIIYTKYSATAVQDSVKYIERYLTTSTTKMLETASKQN